MRRDEKWQYFPQLEAVVVVMKDFEENHRRGCWKVKKTIEWLFSSLVGLTPIHKQDEKINNFITFRSLFPLKMEIFMLASFKTV